MGLAERVPSGDKRDRLGVVHGHAGERLPDVPGRRQRVGLSIGPLGVHIDQAHLHRAERVGQLPIAAVALVAEPGGLGPPIDVLLGLPHVGAAAAETERLESHRLQRHIPGQDHQIGPRDLAAVLLLDRPQHPARLVQAGVVGPAVERSEAMRARAAAAPPVSDAVGAGAVPRHPDDQRPVVAVVGRPPVLRGRQCLFDVGLHRGEVEAVELRGVVEGAAHGIDQRRVHVQRPQVQLFGPPVLVRQRTHRCGRLMQHRAPGCRCRFVDAVGSFAGHDCSLLVRWAGVVDLMRRVRRRRSLAGRRGSDPSR